MRRLVSILVLALVATPMLAAATTPGTVGDTHVTHSPTGTAATATPPTATWPTATPPTPTVPTVVDPAAHGNHVSIDAQVTADGTVVVEGMYSLSGGFLVLHEDRGGEPGVPVGHADLPQGSHTDFEVALDDDSWAGHEGNHTYWVVIHQDVDGNGEFDWGVDEPVSGLGGSTAGARVPVRRGDDDVRVLASDPELGGQRIDAPAATLRRVDLDRPGRVVLRTVVNGTPDTVVGSERLDAGTNRNVTVALDEAFFAELDRDETVRLAATVQYGDDTDASSAVRVGDDPVSTRFSVTKVADAEATTEPLVNTPESTTTEPTDATASKTTDEGSGSTPGFGVAAASCAVVLVGALSRLAM